MRAHTHDSVNIAKDWLASFSAGFRSRDAQSIAETFHPSGFLRDVLTFSWDYRTLEGRKKIAQYLSEKSDLDKVTHVTLTDDRYLQPKPFGSGRLRGIEFGYIYETPIARGKGLVRLIHEVGKGWKGHTVSMIIMDLKGHEEPTRRYSFEEFVDGKSWGEYMAGLRASWEREPHVLIIGAGHIGLQVAARLKQMGIPNLLIERNGRIGDNWRSRYDSLALHSVKEQHQLLYQTHPTNWPVYTPRDRVATMLETYAAMQDLVIWTKSCPIGRPVYDREAHAWTIRVNHNGNEVVLHPAHIVLATGTLGAPYVPPMTHRERFTGDVLHTSEFKNAIPFRKKSVVVVGAGQSGIDICQDLVEGGAASVVLVQRSPMCVAGRDTENIRISQAYSANMPIEVSDFKIASIPRALVCRQAESKSAMEQYYGKLNRDVVEKIQKGGFMVDFSKPQVSLWLEKLGGYWLDKGAADLIASGAIKVKAGVTTTAFVDGGVVFSDGSEASADSVIFATGYLNIREVMTELFGSEVIEKTPSVWGLDSEGETSGSFRPCGYPGLWFAAGEFANARFQSKHLAIMIKAIELGLMEQS